MESSLDESESPILNVGTRRRLIRLLLLIVAPSVDDDDDEPVLVVSVEARYQVNIGHGWAWVEHGNSTVSPDCATMCRKLAIILGGIRDCGSATKKEENE